MFLMPWGLQLDREHSPFLKQSLLQEFWSFVEPFSWEEMSPEQLIDLDKNNIVEVNSLKEINLQEKVGNELPTQ